MANNALGTVLDRIAAARLSPLKRLLEKGSLHCFRFAQGVQNGKVRDAEAFEILEFLGDGVILYRVRLVVVRDFSSTPHDMSSLRQRFESNANLERVFQHVLVPHLSTGQMDLSSVPTGKARADVVEALVGELFLLCDEDAHPLRQSVPFQVARLDGADLADARAGLNFLLQCIIQEAYQSNEPLAPKNPSNVPTAAAAQTPPKPLPESSGARVGESEAERRCREMTLIDRSAVSMDTVIERFAQPLKTFLQLLVCHPVNCKLLGYAEPPAPNIKEACTFLDRPTTSNVFGAEYRVALVLKRPIPILGAKVPGVIEGSIRALSKAEAEAAAAFDVICLIICAVLRLSPGHPHREALLSLIGSNICPAAVPKQKHPAASSAPQSRPTAVPQRFQNIISMINNHQSPFQSRLDLLKLLPKTCLNNILQARSSLGKYLPDPPAEGAVQLRSFIEFDSFPCTHPQPHHIDADVSGRLFASQMLVSWPLLTMGAGAIISARASSAQQAQQGICLWLLARFFKAFGHTAPPEDPGWPAVLAICSASENMPSPPVQNHQAEESPVSSYGSLGDLLTSLYDSKKLSWKDRLTLFTESPEVLLRDVLRIVPALLPAGATDLSQIAMFGQGVSPLPPSEVKSIWVDDACVAIGRLHVLVDWPAVMLQAGTTFEVAAGSLAAAETIGWLCILRVVMRSLCTGDSQMDASAKRAVHASLFSRLRKKSVPELSRPPSPPAKLLEADSACMDFLRMVHTFFSNDAISLAEKLSVFKLDDDGPAQLIRGVLKYPHWSLYGFLAPVEGCELDTLVSFEFVDVGADMDGKTWNNFDLVLRDPSIGYPSRVRRAAGCLKLHWPLLGLHAGQMIAAEASTNEAAANLCYHWMVCRVIAYLISEETTPKQHAFLRAWAAARFRSLNETAAS